MKMLFLDTSVIVAFRNADDVNHERSVRIFENLAAGKHARGLVSDYVILETVTVLKRRCGAACAIETGEALQNSKEIKVLQSSDLFQASWKEFVSLSKMKLGFGDASNLVAMRMYGTKKIATFDEEYRKIKGIEVVG
jgi:predicted nucleic acid-binding protein